MIAETERLILRRYRREDLQDLFEYLSDGEAVKFEPYQFMDLRETEAERMASGEMIAVELKETGKLIGNVYFWTDEHGNTIWEDTFLYGLLNE